MKRRGDAERTVERRGQVDLGAGGAHERGRGEQAEMPPQREIFRQTASATPAPSAPCSAAVSSIATRTATRSRTSRTARQAVRRLLHELQARGGERVDGAHRLLHAPRAVGVEAQSDVRAGGRARRRDAAGVVADAHLELQAAEALRDRLRRLLGGARAVERGRGWR